MVFQEDFDIVFVVTWRDIWLENMEAFTVYETDNLSSRG